MAGNPIPCAVSTASTFAVAAAAAYTTYCFCRFAVCVCVMYELQNGINGCNRISSNRKMFGTLAPSVAHQWHMHKTSMCEWVCVCVHVREKHWIASILVMAALTLDELIHILVPTTHHLYLIELHFTHKTFLPRKKNAQLVSVAQKREI